MTCRRLGWAKPGVLPEKATREEYLNNLAKEANEWFNKKPNDPQALGPAHRPISPRLLGADAFPSPGIAARRPHLAGCQVQSVGWKPRRQQLAAP